MDKQIKSFPLYTISINGMVKREGKEISQSIRKVRGKQYYVVSLQRGDEFNRVSCVAYVHRLVAEVFNMPESPEHSIIRFKDGNTLNCKAFNLQYITAKEVERKTRRGVKHSTATKAKIRQAMQGAGNSRFTGYYVCKFHKYSSAREAARKLKLTAKTVINRCKGGKMKGEGWYFLPK
jgi:hypothetical protein